MERSYRKAHATEITSVVFSADGRYVISGNSDATLKLWDVTGL